MDDFLSGNDYNLLMDIMYCTRCMDVYSLGELYWQLKGIDNAKCNYSNPFEPYHSWVCTAAYQLSSAVCKATEREEHRRKTQKQPIVVRMPLDNEGYAKSDGQYSGRGQTNVAGSNVVKVDSLEDVKADDDEIAIGLTKNDEGKYQVEVVTKGTVAEVAIREVEVPVIKEVIKEVPVEIDNTDQVQVEQLQTLQNIYERLQANVERDNAEIHCIEQIMNTLKNGVIAIRNG